VNAEGNKNQTKGETYFAEVLKKALEQKIKTKGEKNGTARKSN
jgi:hypothetical protein